MIAQNSAQDPICLAAIDVVGPGVYDTNAGTHYFVYGNFSYANQNVSLPHCFRHGRLHGRYVSWHNALSTGFICKQYWL